MTHAGDRDLVAAGLLGSIKCSMGLDTSRLRVMTCNRMTKRGVGMAFCATPEVDHWASQRPGKLTKTLISPAEQI
jgi:hypothetical protein